MPSGETAILRQVIPMFQGLVGTMRGIMRGQFRWRESGIFFFCFEVVPLASKLKDLLHYLLAPLYICFLVETGEVRSHSLTGSPN